MSRTIWSILLFFIPIVLIVGLLRFAFNDGDILFFPPINALISSFNNYPSINDMLQPILKDFANAQLGLSSFTDIASSEDFIQAMYNLFFALGNFFRFIGVVLGIPFRVLAIPFQYVAWFLEWLFEWTGQPT